VREPFRGKARNAMIVAPSHQIEVEARRLLRELIERRPWYPGMKPQEREAAIKADVDRYWRTMQPEAVQSLKARHATAAAKRAA
jgi:hypothetical protein